MMVTLPIMFFLIFDGTHAEITILINAGMVRIVADLSDAAMVQSLSVCTSLPKRPIVVRGTFGLFVKANANMLVAMVGPTCNKIPLLPGLSPASPAS